MKKKIKIIKGGPYIVTGSIPLSENIIEQKNDGNTYNTTRHYNVKDTYSLCRCGKSKNAPFCDGEHTKYNFIGQETASKTSLKEQAEVIYGEKITLYDQENLCAFARFCHDDETDVWELTENETDQKWVDLAIKYACDCPAGRLVMVDNQTGEDIEPVYQPSITILQDPSRKCSGPLWVKGGIPVEGADGEFYEIRNRVTLCRCGKSENKPFCDALHIDGFNDKDEQ